jgi:uncharacterized protein (UPF0261 family)
VQKTVFLTTNLDTRGRGFLAYKRLIETRGLGAILLDFSMEREPDVSGDITCEEVAHAGGMSIAEVRREYMHDRRRATDCMIEGASSYAVRLCAEGRIHGIFGAGGATSTLISTSIMKCLPFGLPKVMASSVASLSSYIASWVGTKDIMMLNTVVDVMGENPFLHRQLTNAVAAVCGMAELYPGVEHALELRSDRPLVGISSFGLTEICAERVADRLEAAGFQPVAFHSQGRGDRALDEMIREGLIVGVIELVPRGICEELLRGDCAAGSDRLIAAGEMGLPMVVAPGGFDQLSVGAQPGWRERFGERKHAVIDEVRVEMRTSAEECWELGALVAERLNRARGPYSVVIPRGGFSSLDQPGRALFDAEADQMFIESLRGSLVRQDAIREVDANICTVEFADACTEAFLTVWNNSRSMIV